MSDKSNLDRFFGITSIEYPDNLEGKESPRYKGIRQWLLTSWLIETEDRYEATLKWDEDPRRLNSKAEVLSHLKEVATELLQHIKYLDPDFGEGGG